MYATMFYFNQFTDHYNAVSTLDIPSTSIATTFSEDCVNISTSYKTTGGGLNDYPDYHIQKEAIESIANNINKLGLTAKTVIVKAISAIDSLKACLNILKDKNTNLDNTYNQYKSISNRLAETPKTINKTIKKATNPLFPKLSTAVSSSQSITVPNPLYDELLKKQKELYDQFLNLKEKCENLSNKADQYIQIIKACNGADIMDVEFLLSLNSSNILTLGDNIFDGFYVGDNVETKLSEGYYDEEARLYYASNGRVYPWYEQSPYSNGPYYNLKVNGSKLKDGGCYLLALTSALVALGYDLTPETVASGKNEYGELGFKIKSDAATYLQKQAYEVLGVNSEWVSIKSGDSQEIRDQKEEKLIEAIENNHPVILQISAPKKGSDIKRGEFSSNGHYVVIAEGQYTSDGYEVTLVNSTKGIQQTSLKRLIDGVFDGSGRGAIIMGTDEHVQKITGKAKK